METKSPMFGMREDKASSVAIFLFASISFVRSSPDSSIVGFGGIGDGRKDLYIISPDKLLTNVPALFAMIASLYSKNGI